MNRKRIILVMTAALLLFTGCADKDAAQKESQNEISMLEQGMEALKYSEYETAIALFQQMAAKEEELEQAYRGIGIAQMGLGEYEAAITSFDQALVNAGADAGSLEYDISYYKAAAMVRLERLNDALDVYNNLADYRPETKTYVGRGAVYARMGNMDKAREDFDKALTQDGKNYDLYIEIFQMLCEGGREDIGQAARSSTEVIVTDGDLLAAQLGNEAADGGELVGIVGIQVIKRETHGVVEIIAAGRISSGACSLKLSGSLVKRRAALGQQSFGEVNGFMGGIGSFECFSACKEPVGHDDNLLLRGMVRTAWSAQPAARSAPRQAAQSAR